MGRITIIILSLLFSLGSVCQETDYVPFNFTAPIPDVILENAGEKAQNELLKKRDSELSSKDKKILYTFSNYALSGVMRSGEVYFNDEYSAYLNGILNDLIPEDELKACEVYLCKSEIPNAISWRDGTILVNMGLIPYLESEAELAFILAHEFIHYKKRHVVKQKKEDSDAINQYGNENQRQALLRSLRFSRSQETYADRLAFEIIEESKYDVLACKSALKKLEITKYDYVSQPNIGNWFMDADKYIIEIEDEEEENEEENEDEKSGKRSAIDIENESTHPSIEKRLQEIDRLLEKHEADTSSTSVYAFNIEMFSELKSIAVRELAQSNYSKSYYARSAFLALTIMEADSSDRFARDLLANSLYWILYYKMNDMVDVVVPPDDIADGSSMNWLFNLIDEKKVSDLIKDFETIFPAPKESDAVLISYAKMLELQENDDSAEKAYKQFVKNFPNSKHFQFAKAKLK